MYVHCTTIIAYVFLPSSSLSSRYVSPWTKIISSRGYYYVFIIIAIIEYHADLFKLGHYSRFVFTHKLGRHTAVSGF